MNSDLIVLAFEEKEMTVSVISQDCLPPQHVLQRRRQVQDHQGMEHGRMQRALRQGKCLLLLITAFEQL